MKITYVYVPGLGDESLVEKQRQAFKKWRSANRDTVFLESKWQDSTEHYPQKLARLIRDLKSQVEPGSAICIFGTSAGGTLGFNLFMAIKDDYNACFVSGSGKITGSNAIGPRYAKPHPALIPSVLASEDVLSSQLDQDTLRRILCVTPLVDEVVYPRFMKIKGADHKKIWVISHVLSIVWLIAFRKDIVINFAKKRLKT